MRHCIWISVAVLLLNTAVCPVLYAQSGASSYEANLVRLESMSKEHRATLAKNLDDFSSLDRDARDAMRRFDNELSKLDANSRAHYLSVLRRYHVFYQQLSEPQRKQIDDANDPSKKLELITRFRADFRDNHLNFPGYIDAVQVSSLTPIRLRPLARELIVYFSLDPVKDAKERSEFARMKNPSDRQSYVRKLIHSREFEDRTELRERLRDEEAEFREAELRVRNNPKLSKRMRQIELDLSKDDPGMKKKADSPKLKDTIASKLKNGPPRFREIVEKLDEQEVLRELDSAVVEKVSLDRFDAALPLWARQSFDDLPPDAARRRLKALYRLVFPSPLEYVPPKATTINKPNPATAAPPTGDGSPF